MYSKFIECLIPIFSISTYFFVWLLTKVDVDTILMRYATVSCSLQPISKIFLFSVLQLHPSENQQWGGKRRPVCVLTSISLSSQKAHGSWWNLKICYFSRGLHCISCKHTTFSFGTTRDFLLCNSPANFTRAKQVFKFWESFQLLTSKPI